MIRQYKLRFYNFKLVALLLAISLFGVQLVASASPDQLRCPFMVRY